MCDKTFNNIKNILLSYRDLARFDFKLPLKLTVDVLGKALLSTYF